MINSRVGCFCSCGQQQYYECGNMLHDFECEYHTARRYAKVALCESRHDIPEAEDGAIFGNTLNPKDVYGIEREAKKVISESGVESLYVYVTGLSVALVAVINVCRELGVELTLMHYDRDTNRYYEQEVRQ